MTVVAPTDCPKSVPNRCVIERFVTSLCFFTYALLSFRCVYLTSASDLFPSLLSSRIRPSVRRNTVERIKDGRNFGRRSLSRAINLNLMHWEGNNQHWNKIMM